MIDKYVDMEISRDEEVANAPERSRPALIDTKRALKKADFAYAHARSQCHEEISKNEFDCAMRAESPEGWQACID